MGYWNCNDSCKCNNSCHSETELVTVLTGSQEVPPVQTSGQGAGTFVLSSDKKTLHYEIYFKNLTAPVQNVGNVGFAHLHLGPAGVNGPVVKPLKFCLSSDMKSGKAEGEWNKCEKDWPFKKEYMKALLDGGIYVNIHSEAHPGGEVRGQIIKQHKH